MKWGTRLVAAVVAVSLAGCASEPSSATDDNTDMELLVQRTYALKEKVGTAGRMTPELRTELTLLARDFEAWQQRTGRNDISVSHSRPARDEGVAARQVAPGSPTTCETCPLITNMGGRICFLVDDGPCTDGIISKVCVYMCLTVPSRTQRS
jgi:hypothetical protein